MSKVVTTIEIAAPRAEVWDVVTDPQRLAEWVTIHRRLGPVSDPPLREGSEMEQHLVLRGAPFTVHWTVADLRDQERIVWEGRGPAHSHASTVYELSDLADGGTCFHYENEFKAPGGLLGAAASRALVGGHPEREAKRSLDRLKALLEA